MTNTRHTPGPWCINHPDTENALENRKHLWITGKSSEYWNTLADVHFGLSDEAWANARLIAAAPEMEDAISGALRDIGDILRSWDRPASKEQLEAVERDLRVVLTKASFPGLTPYQQKVVDRIRESGEETIAVPAPETAA
jgi:hypothetical protein